MSKVHHQNLTRRRDNAKTTGRAPFASFAPLREAFRHETTGTTSSRLGCMTVLLLAFAFFTGCQPQTPATEQSDAPKLSHQVTAASYPLAYFAKQLAGDSIEVQMLTPPAESTKPWRPSRAEILSMQKSDIIFVNGSAAPFAPWLPHVTLPESKICATANDGLKLSDMIAVEDIRIVHSHGPEGEHSHPTMVAHTWLDPTMIKQQLAIMAERLSDTYPNLTQSIMEREVELATQLDDYTEGLNKYGSRFDKESTVFTSTPDLKFLTRQIGINDVHLNWRTPPDLLDAKSQLEQKLSSLTQRPEFILFSAEPSSELRSAVEDLDLRIIVIETMSGPPSEGDYFTVMQDNLKRMARAFDAKQTDAKPDATDPEQN